MALTFLALGRKLLELLFLFRFFFPFLLFLLCVLSIFLFTSRYTRHKYQLQINNKHQAKTCFLRIIEEANKIQTDASFFHFTKEANLRLKEKKSLAKLFIGA